MRSGPHSNRQPPRLLGAVLVAALALTLPALSARAAPAPATPAEVSRLEAECARLRTELDRANAEVAALKRGDRGVRNDYRLRQRLADAEALARKLTDAEAQLRARTVAPAPLRAPALAPPSAQPGDGPVELEAKADLLSDQARRLAGEAAELARTAGQLRGRQTLRKRAFQLERDPFAGLDGSKRTLVFGSARTPGKNGTENGSQAPGDSVADTGNKGAGGASGSTANPMPTGGGGAAPPPMGASGNAPVSGAAPAPTAPPAPTRTGESFTGPAPQPTGALSTQLRTLLDPATLSEVQRLERTGKPIADPEALEKLAAALRLRAQSLDAQAKSLRARAKP